VWEIFVLRVIVIVIFSTRGFPLEEASEVGFLSIKISLLVLLFSIFCCFIGICCNIYVSSYYNTSGTLHCISCSTSFLGDNPLVSRNTPLYTYNNYSNCCFFFLVHPSRDAFTLTNSSLVDSLLRKEIHISY
jgi:hypothetical protein